MKTQPLDIPSEWDINISILKNPLLWFQLVMVSLISSSFLLLLLVGLNLFEHRWDDIPASFTVASVLAGGLFIALALMLFLMYWRGIPTRYILRDDYIEQHTLVRRKKALGFMGLLALLSGKSAGATAAGASLLAHSREQISIRWKDISSVESFPSRNEIQLHDEWHTAMQVVCPENQFEEILHIIQQKTETSHMNHKTTLLKETPFAHKVMLSTMALVFGLFLFPRLPIHIIGIFSIGMILFSLLSLWSEGWKQRLFGSILFALPIIGVVLAFIVGEVDMNQKGNIYALSVEVIILGFFLFLGLGVFLKRIR